MVQFGVSLDCCALGRSLSTELFEACVSVFTVSVIGGLLPIVSHKITQQPCSDEQ
jgi:hypothetical protein